ncbi:hypothetical protein OC845_003157 [Tilletia horrida]|nr:hypothetical protein OC845_003157 [Tilletia horrida]
MESVLRKKLKDFQRQFVAEHGRAPGKSDMSKYPDIQAAYDTWHAIRNVAGPSASASSSKTERQKEKLTSRPQDAAISTPTRKQNPFASPKKQTAPIITPPSNNNRTRPATPSTVVKLYITPPHPSASCKAKIPQEGDQDDDGFDYANSPSRLKALIAARNTPRTKARKRLRGEYVPPTPDKQRNSSKPRLISAAAGAPTSTDEQDREDEDEDVDEDAPEGLGGRPTKRRRKAPIALAAAPVPSAAVGSGSSAAKSKFSKVLARSNSQPTTAIKNLVSSFTSAQGEASRSQPEPTKVQAPSPSHPLTRQGDNPSKGSRWNIAQIELSDTDEDEIRQNQMKGKGKQVKGKGKARDTTLAASPSTAAPASPDKDSPSKTNKQTITLMPYLRHGTVRARLQEQEERKRTNAKDSSSGPKRGSPSKAPLADNRIAWNGGGASEMEVDDDEGANAVQVNGNHETAEDEEDDSFEADEYALPTSRNLFSRSYSDPLHHVRSNIRSNQPSSSRVRLDHHRSNPTSDDDDNTRIVGVKKQEPASSPPPSSPSSTATVVGGTHGRSTVSRSRTGTPPPSRASSSHQNLVQTHLLTAQNRQAAHAQRVRSRAMIRALLGELEELDLDAEQAQNSASGPGPSSSQQKGLENGKAGKGLGGTAKSWGQAKEMNRLESKGVGGKKNRKKRVWQADEDDEQESMEKGAPGSTSSGNPSKKSKHHGDGVVSNGLAAFSIPTQRTFERVGRAGIGADEIGSTGSSVYDEEDEDTFGEEDDDEEEDAVDADVSSIGSGPEDEEYGGRERRFRRSNALKGRAKSRRKGRRRTAGLGRDSDEDWDSEVLSDEYGLGDGQMDDFDVI